ncbi:tRNA nucleotidyltransferase [Candidatus Similichlamydia laticola]|uniref:tRNA nucleotidyltransferase n=2 Tax=Candidatus Similichlamydia laticola TaxID=2170265 RepID=A0A369KCR5_9BACT|nr:tRNA nucleotidyltransferase [Candidatus Similichlamydia laticola]
MLRHLTYTDLRQVMDSVFKLQREEIEQELFQLALRIVKRLHQERHVTYMAGGCVRDWILGRVPHDIDLATSASAQFLCSLFKKTVRTGMQFESIRIIEEGQSVEVSSFRQDGPYQDGRRPLSIRPASAQEDAQRRDFTINGLFYCPLTHTLFDYVGGYDDLAKKIIRTIGDPYERFKEDKLRLIRAIRFASKLECQVEPATYQAIKDLAPEIDSISKERIYDELTKICADIHAQEAFSLLSDTQLLGEIFKGLYTPPLLFDLGEVRGPFALWAICLFILSQGTFRIERKIKEALEQKLSFSKREKQALSFGVEFGETLQRDPAFSNLPIWCRLLASPFYDELHPLLKEEDQNHLTQITLSRLKLIQVLRRQKHLLSGTALQKRGITGPLCGKLLEKATDLAIWHNYLEEEEILNLLYKNGSQDRTIC